MNDEMKTARMVKRLRAWPFPMLRNYDTDSALTTLFFEFAEHSELEVFAEDTHWIEVWCPMGRLRFWNANRFYAWAQQGTYSTGHKQHEWRGVMPSRAANRAMSLRLAAIRFRPFAPSTEAA